MARKSTSAAPAAETAQASEPTPMKVETPQNEQRWEAQPTQSESDVLKARLEASGLNLDGTEKDAVPPADPAPGTSSDSPDAGEKAEVSGEQAEPKKETHREHRARWWDEKTPEERARLKETQALKAEIAELKKQIAAFGKAEPQKGSREKTEFANEQEYLDYRIDERLKQIGAERDAIDAEEAKRQAARKRIDDIFARDIEDEEEREAVKRIIKERVNAGEMNLSDDVCEYILGSEVGGLIFRHLAMHPEAVPYLGANVSRFQVGERLAKISAFVAKQKSQSKTQPAPAQKTPTPEPRLKVATGSANVSGGLRARTDNDLSEQELRDLLYKR